MTELIQGIDQSRGHAAGSSWAVFLDFDGTLVDIVERPDAVEVDPGLPETLGLLQRVLGGALAIVSGRNIRTIDAFLTPYRGDVAGLHGLEYRIDGHVVSRKPEDFPELRRGVERLRRETAVLDGVLVEDKGCSVALHWRQAPVHAAAAQAMAGELARELGPGYRLQQGKAVAEILPAASGKGAVIERLLEETPYRGRRPLFIGDDLTDEGGFVVVNARGGASVRVGGGETQATHRVGTPAEIRDWLSRWAAQGAVALP